ncbi:MAG: hypothetical protein ACO3WU_01575 [Ilumatobacteraceae bacterium]
MRRSTRSADRAVRSPTSTWARIRTERRRALDIGAAAAVLAALIGASGCSVRVDVVAIDATRAVAPAADPGATAPALENATPDDSTPVSEETSLAVAELLVDIPIADVIDIGDGKPPQPHAGFAAVALADVERWWTEVFPSLYGVDFEPLAGGVFAGYPGRSPDIPGCGTSTTPYADLQLYVAFYCQFGDFMAYDDGDGPDSLLTPLADEFGPAVIGVVLAHEFGHAVQSRIGALDEPIATIFTEQQADCFAGAWTGQAYRGESPFVRLGDRDIRAGLLAMLSVRDPVGTDQFVVGGHGSAFDRVGAFQEGFLGGAERCATLLDQPLDLMPNRFQTGIDAFFEGNAPYDCTELDPDIVGQDFIDACTPAPVFLADDLDDFWRTRLGDGFQPVGVVAERRLDDIVCPDLVRLDRSVAVCPGDRTVHYDEPNVIALYREVGDFGLGYLYGIAWAELALQELGSTATGEPRALLADCFTGAWVRDITPDRNGVTPRQGDRDGDGTDDSVVSSPGDLDEAIRMTILIGDERADSDVVGAPFEKIEAFRVGVLGGLDACAALA